MSGREWQLRGAFEASSGQTPPHPHSLPPPCSLWRSHGWGCFRVGSIGLPGPEWLFCLLETDGSLHSPVPLPACCFLPVGRCLFALCEGDLVTGHREPMPKRQCPPWVCELKMALLFSRTRWPISPFHSHSKPSFCTRMNRLVSSFGPWPH